jgi:hypothetical protein
VRLDFVRAPQAVSTVLGKLKALELHVIDSLASIQKYRNRELNFRALLTQDGVRQLELVHA